MFSVDLTHFFKRSINYLLWTAERGNSQISMNCYQYFIPILEESIIKGHMKLMESALPSYIMINIFTSKQSPVFNTKDKAHLKQIEIIITYGAEMLWCIFVLLNLIIPQLLSLISEKKSEEKNVFACLCWKKI